MLRLILFIAVVALLAPLFIDLPRGNPLDPSAEGGQIVIQTADLEVRFDRRGEVSETYMLFGGMDGEMHNSISNVLLSGLAQRHVALISQRYPKFYMCSSPGAAQAQSLIEDVALIAADGSTRGTLQKAVRLHEQAVASGGDRTCIRFHGERLSLESAKIRSGAVDLTREIARGYRDTDFYYVSGAEITDCKSLL